MPSRLVVCKTWFYLFISAIQSIVKLKAFTAAASSCNIASFSWHFMVVQVFTAIYCAIFFFWTFAVQSIVKFKAFILLLRRHYFLTLFDIFRLSELVLEVLKAVQVSPSNSVPDTFASFLDHFWSFSLVTRCRTQLEDRRKLSNFEMVHSFLPKWTFFMFSSSLSALTWVKIFLKVYLWYLLSAGVLCNM